MELAQEAIRLEDEEFRVWYGLDSPEASEGIGLLQSGEGYEQLTIALATNSRMAMKNAIEVTVLENMNLFGNNLIRIADGIGGAPILFFITIWDDECSPEGAKQGCAIENVNITYCGHSPDSVKKMLSFAKKLPFGGVAIAAATLITRLNYPVSIYVKCKFDDCMDTPCLPLVGTELEWVEQENWVEIKNDNIDTGGVGDCWLPQNWNGRTRMLFRQHMIKVLQQECGC